MDALTGLTRIGFTEYEAKVYLSLLNENPANGYQISKKSGVPRSMVYEALGRLSARGAVLETIEGRATLYRPLPPEVLLDRHEDEQRRMAVTLRQGLGKLYTKTDEERVWSITGRQPTLSFAAQMVKETQRDLFLVLADDDLEILHPEITKAYQRGVSVNALLTGEGELDCGQIARHPPLESELQEITGTLVVVADNHTALIASSDTDPKATITTNHNLVLMARQFIWMELFAQRIHARLGSDLIDQLDPEDRQIFLSLGEA
jgi:Cd2+/Zn2+-exporting ATPase